MRINAVASHAAPPKQSVPPFLGKKNLGVAKLGGLTGSRLETSKEAHAAAKKLTLHSDWPFSASAFSFKPAELKAVDGSATKRKALLNDVLFAGANFDVSMNPSYFGVDRLTAKKISGASAGSTLAKTLTDYAGKDLTAAKKAEVEKNAKALAASMLDGGTTAVYACTWTNQDDTQVHGVVSLNEKTGQVRVIGWYPQG